MITIFGFYISSKVLFTSFIVADFIMGMMLILISARRWKALDHILNKRYGIQKTIFHPLEGIHFNFIDDFVLNNLPLIGITVMSITFFILLVSR